MREIIQQELDVHDSVIKGQQEKKRADEIRKQKISNLPPNVRMQLMRHIERKKKEQERGKVQEKRKR